jgi:CheY-like chemotaxis protein
MPRILHVEDEDIWRTFVKQALADHHIDSAASADQALHYLQGSAPYDLALVDLHLIKPGDLLGGEILDLLRTRYPLTRRIVVTGSPPRGPLRANIFERYEVEEIIIKGDVTLPDLRRVVEGALDLTMWDVPQEVKLRKSELRQRFRDWRRSQQNLINDKIREAEEYLRHAEKLHGQSGRRAQEELNLVIAQRDLLKSDCSTIENSLDHIFVMNDVFRVLDELERAEVRHAEGATDQRADRRDF